MKWHRFFVASMLFAAIALAQPKAFDKATYPAPVILAGESKHLSNLHQLSFGGENAEAYWAPNNQEIIFQSTRPPFDCDQIFIMPADGSNEGTLVSTGKGRCTCSYFLPGSDRIVFSSTHAGSATCPQKPHGKAYTWMLNPDYEIYSVTRDGADLKNISNHTGYDAEAVASPDGKAIVFTSNRDGDIDIYRMNSEGGDVKRLTNRRGYDGGAWWSPDGKKLVWRADYPHTPADMALYDSLLAKNQVQPSRLELWMMDADGSNPRQLTTYGVATFAPVWLPDNRHIFFVSNLLDPKGRNFDVFMLDTEKPGKPEQITFFEGFDGFPMPSPDGKRVIFCSNRNGSHPHETNVFVADWKW